MGAFAWLIFLLAVPSSLQKQAPHARPSYLRLQVLLDRAHFSPGEIDGVPGDNTRQALRAFRASHALHEQSDFGPRTLTAFVAIPKDLMDQAALPALGYQSSLEALSEKFHVKPALLSRLNQGKDLSSAGVQIQVPNVSDAPPPKAAKIIVSKTRHTLEVFNSAGRLVAEYPVTSGSQHDPLPIGNWKVTVISQQPVFHYNPDLFWNAPEADEKAKIQPGPNNPVGVVWIGISKEHYGIHGTPEPSLVGHAESHGCVRLTNWDAAELAKIVTAGAPVIFKQ
jgi:lipoprotein-anchoring transpeptidase ErfK/SrfK